MGIITTRAGKGSPLTNTEVDTNFQYLDNGKLATRNSVEAGTATTGMLIPDTTEYVFTPAMTRVFNVFIPETLTAEILVYTHGTDGIYITTERRIRLNCGGGFYESEVLPTSVLGDSLEIAISRADNEASTVTVFFVVNGVQFGATQVSAFSDLYIRSLLTGIDGFFLTVSPGTTATTNAGTTRVSDPAEAIGLLYDGGPNAEDFSQATSTARPLIGRVPVGGRRNLFLNTENFRDAYWEKNSGASILSTDTAGPIAGTFAQVLSGATGTVFNGAVLRKSFTPPSASWSSFISIKSMGTATTATLYYRDGTTGIVQSNTVDLTDGQWKTATRAFTLVNNGMWFVGGTNGDVAVFGGQYENGAATAYQRVGASARDITESGIPNTWYAFFDLSDDILTTTVPAITNGTIVIAGTNGIWIDTLTVSAGTFNIGATTHTGGPSGLLAVVGNVIGAFVINRALTAPEQAAVVAYYKAKGSPGFFEVTGVELVTNGTFDTDITGWTAGNGAVLAWNAGGYIDVTGDGASFGGNARQAVTLVVGQTYIGGVTCIAEGSDARIRIQTSTNPGTSVNTQESLNAGSVARRLFTATATTTYILLENNGTTGTSTFDVATIRAITLNTGA